MADNRAERAAESEKPCLIHALLPILLDCWTAPCMSGRFYTEPQEQRPFVLKEVTGIGENRANRV